MPIRIHNVRLGHATNSSSTHSIVFLPKGHVEKDSTSGAEFGWDYFTAASKSAKADYLAIVVHDALRGSCGTDIADAVTRAWVGVDRPADGGIDHQSSITLPHSWDGKGLEKDFVEDFVKFVMREDVAILGGNDNDGRRHDLLSVGKDGGLRQALPIETSDNYVAKKDPSGFWTLFSRTNGTKLRVSFDGDQSMLAAPTRSATPELVDLKITDWCDIGCRYCYQGSTVKGEHAHYNKFYALAEAFEQMRVFEVAIGGGEPTTHPQFSDILGMFRHHGIVPNFTTKSTAWMTGKDRERILEFCGSFAFSVETAADLTALMDVCEKAEVKGKSPYRLTDESRHKMVIQHVMGTDASQEAFEDLLRECAKHHLEITLLGYKSVGRGKSLNAPRYDWWLDSIKKLRKDGVYVGIGIDTALSSEYRAEIKAAGVHSKLYDIHEGAFSMYIDAVKNRIGPSSYHEALLRDSELAKDAILEHYNSLPFAVLGAGRRGHA